MFNESQKMDLIFSVGCNCENSLSLRKCNLQIASYPFDWLGCSDFETNLNYIINDFKNFFNKDDLEIVKDSSNGVHNKYKNKYSELEFVHDFPINKNFNEQYYKVKEKYDKRIKRLQNKIQNSKNVLIVYNSYTPVNIEFLREKCKDFNTKFRIKFPNTKIFYLYIINNREEKFDLIDNNLNLRILANDFSITKKYLNFGGIKFSTKVFKLDKILKAYKLKICFSERILSYKYFLKKVLINLIPDKNLALCLRHKNRYR